MRIGLFLEPYSIRGKAIRPPPSTHGLGPEIAELREGPRRSRAARHKMDTHATLYAAPAGSPIGVSDGPRSVSAFAVGNGSLLGMIASFEKGTASPVYGSTFAAGHSYV
jgi:hypothetical protein